MKRGFKNIDELKRKDPKLFEILRASGQLDDGEAVAEPVQVQPEQTAPQPTAKPAFAFKPRPLPQLVFQPLPRIRAPQQKTNWWGFVIVGLFALPYVALIHYIATAP